MEIVVTKTIHITLEEDEAGEIVKALKLVSKVHIPTDKVKAFSDRLSAATFEGKE